MKCSLWSVKLLRNVIWWNLNIGSPVMEFSTMKIDEELWEMCVMKSNNRKCNYEKCTLWSLIIESLIMRNVRYEV